jgi:hypothetical protein
VCGNRRLLADDLLTGFVLTTHFQFVCPQFYVATISTLLFTLTVVGNGVRNTNSVPETRFDKEA